MFNPFLIFIAGPTAIGKSDVAFELAKAIGGEIVSCDAMQIYKEVTIASNKPSKEMTEEVKHHMIDIVSLKEDFDVAQYHRMASSVIDNILEQEKIPIIVGGSGLYMQALLDGLFAGAPKDEALRQELEERIEQEGSEKLHDELVKVDPKAAAKIHPNDKRRIIRALEVFQTQGKPISSLQPQREGLWGRHKIYYFGLNRDREALYNRINERVDEMFDHGLIEEVKANLEGLSHTAQMLIGIKEVASLLNNECSIEQAKNLMKKNTRHYAKRQLTWFRHDERIEWIDVDDILDAQVVAKKLEERIST